MSVILFVLRNELRWQDAPAANSSHRALYSRFVRFSRFGVFARILRDLALPGRDGETIMMDSTHLKAHRTAASLHETRLNASGRSRGGVGTKACAVCDAAGRALAFSPLPGQGHEWTCAPALLVPAVNFRAIVAW